MMMISSGLMSIQAEKSQNKIQIYKSPCEIPIIQPGLSTRSLQNNIKIGFGVPNYVILGTYSPVCFFLKTFFLRSSNSSHLRNHE